MLVFSYRFSSHLYMMIAQKKLACDITTSEFVSYYYYFFGCCDVKYGTALDLLSLSLSLSHTHTD